MGRIRDERADTFRRRAGVRPDRNRQLRDAAMLKKVTAKQDKKIEAAIRAQFATDVIELYRARMAGQEATHPDPEVCAVAFGLVALKQGIEPALQKHRNNPQALVYTGAVVADEIINAL